MADIDDKVHALEFTITTASSRDTLHRLITEAAEQARPERIILADFHETGVTGIARNQLRVQHAAFKISIEAAAGESLRVQLQIPNYMRTRDTIGGLIPVGPWSAPAYSTLKRFSDHVRAVLDPTPAGAAGE